MIEHIKRVGNQDLYSPTKPQRPGLLKRYNLYSVFLKVEVKLDVFNVRT